MEQFEQLFRMIRDNFTTLPHFIENYIALNLIDKAQQVIPEAKKVGGKPKAEEKE
jgi:hypothetical protein